MTTNPPTLKKKDFGSDQLVRWCPGCGDYSILAQVQTVFAELGYKKEEYAIIAGIGCSSRFPYYMSTYGFHTIHGRAPAFASGLKCTRPELSVWMVTGDGDGLSIGGNHLLHLWRRNIDINVMMFNNRIYGLTKGQYSPTSEVGKKTKSSPYGSLDTPVDPIQLALGAGSSWVARSADAFTKHLRETLKAAEANTGTSYVEIYQNCNTFNDGAFEDSTGRESRKEHVLYLEEGQPMIWGKTERKGLKLNGLKLEVFAINTEEDEAKALIHDPTNKMMAIMLAGLDGIGENPIPMGIIYNNPRPSYDSQFHAQVETVTHKLGQGDLEKMLHAGDTWTV
ncbi:MAG: 2-oxoacid:ferredoxin oxidoreductase subunit beta [Rhodobacterales bacterium]|nr:2-oxoacid:ferredoxin oxidoreductase subunit beta [Rhodobacterales bacterium]